MKQTPTTTPKADSTSPPPLTVEEPSATAPIVRLNNSEDSPAPNDIPKAPEFAIIACKDKHEGEYCEANNGTIRGTCYNLMKQLTCIPKERHR